MSSSNGDVVMCRERDGTVVVRLSVDDSDVLDNPADETDKRLRACVDKAAAEKLVASSARARASRWGRPKTGPAPCGSRTRVTRSSWSPFPARNVLHD
jgi:hypothetical protein